MQKATFGKRGAPLMAEQGTKQQDKPAVDTLVYGSITFLIAGILTSFVLLVT